MAPSWWLCGFSEVVQVSSSCLTREQDSLTLLLPLVLFVPAMGQINQTVSFWQKELSYWYPHIQSPPKC